VPVIDSFLGIFMVPADLRSMQIKKQKSTYCEIVVHSVLGTDSQGRRKRQILPIPGQKFSASLNVECSKKLTTRYPIGTRFLIRAKLTDMQGVPFLYSYFGWPYTVL
jgi:hypothetical protein